MKIFSKNTWGVDVNNAWPLTCKASCLKKIELRPLISGFDFALLEVRNLCVASRLCIPTQSVPIGTSVYGNNTCCIPCRVPHPLTLSLLLRTESVKTLLFFEISTFSFLKISVSKFHYSMKRSRI